MKLADRVKSISYLKANAPAIVRQLSEDRQPFVITSNGEAKMVLQDIKSFEQTQETLAFLKLLALSEADVAEGRVQPMKETFERLRKRRGR